MLRTQGYDKNDLLLIECEETLWEYAELAEDLIPKVAQYNLINAKAEYAALKELTEFLETDQTGLVKDFEDKLKQWKSKINSWKEALVTEKLNTLPRDKYEEKLWEYVKLAKDFITKVDQYNLIDTEAELVALNELTEFLQTGQVEDFEAKCALLQSKINSWKKILVKKKLNTLPRDKAEQSLIESKTEAVDLPYEQPPISSMDWYELYSKAIDLFNEAMLLSTPHSLTKLSQALEYCEKSKKLNAHFPHLDYLCGKIHAQLVDEPHHFQKALQIFEEIYYSKKVKKSDSPDNKDIREQAKQEITKISKLYNGFVRLANKELKRSPQSQSSLDKALDYCQQAIDLNYKHAPAYYVRGRIYQQFARLEHNPERKNSFLNIAMKDLRKCRVNFASYTRRLNHTEQDVNVSAEKQLKKLICSRLEVECDVDNTLVAGEAEAKQADSMQILFEKYKNNKLVIPEVNALKFLNPKYVYKGRTHEKCYVIFPGAIEFGKWMDDLGIRFSYYSTGSKERNDVLCAQFQSELNLTDSHHKPKKLPRIISRDDCYNPKKINDWGVKKDQRDSRAKQLQNYGIPETDGPKKVLAKLHKDNFDYTVLIDNLLKVISSGEEKNALCTNSEVKATDFRLNLNSNVTIEQLLKLNQIFGIVGVLNEAIDMTVKNGEPFTDNLFSLQFEPAKQTIPTPQLFQKCDKTYTPVNFFAPERYKYFESGLKILRKYNPNLRFYGHDLLKKLVREQKAQAALNQTQAQCTPGTP